MQSASEASDIGPLVSSERLTTTRQLHEYSVNFPDFNDELFEFHQIFFQSHTVFEIRISHTIICNKKNMINHVFNLLSINCLHKHL